MSADHRRPVVAFVVLALAAAAIVGLQRAEAHAGRFLAGAIGGEVRVHGTLALPDEVAVVASPVRSALGPAFASLDAMLRGDRSGPLLLTAAADAPHGAVSSVTAARSHSTAAPSNGQAHQARTAARTRARTAAPTAAEPGRAGRARGADGARVTDHRVHARHAAHRTPRAHAAPAHRMARAHVAHAHRMARAHAAHAPGRRSHAADARRHRVRPTGRAAAPGRPSRPGWQAVRSARRGPAAHG